MDPRSCACMRAAEAEAEDEVTRDGWQQTGAENASDANHEGWELLRAAGWW